MSEERREISCFRRVFYFLFDSFPWNRELFLVSRPHNIGNCFRLTSCGVRSWLPLASNKRPTCGTTGRSLLICLRGLRWTPGKETGPNQYRVQETAIGILHKWPDCNLRPFCIGLGSRCLRFPAGLDGWAVSLAPAGFHLRMSGPVSRLTTPAEHGVTFETWVSGKLTIFLQEWWLTSGSIDKIFDFLDERFDGQTGLFKLLLVGMKIFSEIGAVSKALGELEWQEPHDENWGMSVW